VPLFVLDLGTVPVGVDQGESGVTVTGREPNPGVSQTPTPGGEHLLGGQVS
jgi:hypothetical protein